MDDDMTANTNLNSPTDVRRMTLPAGHRFVMLINGEKPWIVPITEPGVYDIDAPVILRKAPAFPIRVFVVPDHVAAEMARANAKPLHKDIIS